MSKQKLKRKRTYKPIELRYLPTAAAQFEFRESVASGGATITGYASLFAPSRTDMGSFQEVVAPTAFDAALNGNADVRCLWNHNPDHVLGRTKSGTLRLSKDSRGLLYEAELPNTTLASDLAESMRRGDVDQSSYGFFVTDESWEMDDNGVIVRTLLSVSLFDVSPVTYPANPNTVSKVRAQFPHGDEHIRERIAALRSRRDDDDDDDEPCDPTIDPDCDPDNLDGDVDEQDSSIRCSCRCERCLNNRCERCIRSECSDAVCYDRGCAMPGQDENRSDHLRIARHFNSARLNLYL
jgi:HK97 family phage prohead protease